MAKKKVIEEHILHDNLEDIMADRFARYSKYIIQERALPDARDGLKPVQRRILYAMYEDGNTYNRPYRKSAKTVGNVIGNYHPHGDSSVYDAMVRMSQDWKMTHPLVDMQGNNGSIDDDPAAAMRYTEARLSEIADYFMDGIDKDTVQWAPNFSDDKMEPTVLPARVPNLLINGITGIAAGYATNIPPHNLNEVVDAIIYRIGHPDCSLDELMQFVKGPDFPTGGIVMGKEGIRQAFETGKGKVIIRSKVDIHTTRSLQQIVVSEIPYDVVKSNMVKRIDDIRLNKKVDGIMDVRDESDRTGLRVVIDIKNDANVEAILNYLYKNTDLQVSYNYNTIAIVDKAPVQMSLAAALDAFIAHREDVVLRRSRYELDHKEKRSHILEGLIHAVSVMDEIIQIIRNSKNKADAKVNLMETFDFTEPQAEAIVTMRLYRLTNTDVKELRDEFKQLAKDIKALKAIIKHRDVLHSVIIAELEEINEKIPTRRRTVVEDEIEDIVIDEKAMIADEQVMVPLTRDGYLKKVSLRSYNASPDFVPGKKDGDPLVCVGQCSTLDTLLFFTDKGTYGYIPVYQIEEAKWKDLGTHLSSYVKINSNEKIIQAYIVKEFRPDVHLVMASRFGMIKQTRLSELEVSRANKTMVCMRIGSMDEMISVQLSQYPTDSVVLASEQGFALSYPVEQVSLMACKSKGVKSMNLSKGDRVADMIVVNHLDKQLLVINNQCQMKRIKMEEVSVLNRPAKGTRICKWVKTNPTLITVIAETSADQELHMMTDEPVRLEAKDVPLMNPTSTFSTVLGKQEVFEIHRPLTEIQEGQWPQEDSQEFQQGTLFE